MSVDAGINVANCPMLLVIFEFEMYIFVFCFIPYEYPDCMLFEMKLKLSNFKMKLP